MEKKFTEIERLECSLCGKSYDPFKVQNICQCGGSLIARYDLEDAKEIMDRRSLSKRVLSPWRYHELLPLKDPANIVTLGEGMTPLLSMDRLGEKLGLKDLMIKDEGMNPTGTFKARGATAGVSKAKELGIESVTVPTNGNAGAAWATYAARAGMESYIVMPRNGPAVTRKEITAAGSHAYLVDGRITDANLMSEQLQNEYGVFNAATLKEPYRLEGKKTMGLEIMEQLNWEAPDVIAFPTGGGVGLIGIHKAIMELNEMGWVDEMKTRMVCVQAAGCAPITEAWEKRKKTSVMWKESDTVAFGMNVPKSRGDFMVLESLYSSGGYATSVEDDEILRTKQLIGREEGLFACPEGSSAVAGIKKLLDQGFIDRNEKVIVVNTGSGLKYPHTVDASLPLLQPGERISIEMEENVK